MTRLNKNMPPREYPRARCSKPGFGTCTLLGYWEGCFRREVKQNVLPWEFTMESPPVIARRPKADVAISEIDYLWN
jgi:hypothetical protein